MKRMKRVAVATLFIMVSAGLLAWDTESVHSNAPARAETDTLGIDTLFITPRTSSSIHRMMIEMPLCSVWR